MFRGRGRGRDAYALQSPRATLAPFTLNPARSSGSDVRVARPDSTLGRADSITRRHGVSLRWPVLRVGRSRTRQSPVGRSTQRTMKLPPNRGQPILEVRPRHRPTLTNKVSHIKRQRNHGVRKVCGCGRAKWPKCRHSWDLNFKPKGQAAHYRLSLDRVIGRHIETKIETPSRTLRRGEGGRNHKERNKSEIATIARTPIALPTGETKPLGDGWWPASRL
jgi:hypothetical protein